MSTMHLRSKVLEQDEGHASSSNVVHTNLAVTPAPGAQLASARTQTADPVANPDHEEHSRYTIDNPQQSNGYTFHTVVRSQGEHSPAIVPANDSIKNSISSSLEEQVVKPPRVFHVIEARKTGQPTELISLKSSDIPDEPYAARSRADDLIRVETSREAQEAAMYITERSHE